MRLILQNISEHVATGFYQLPIRSLHNYPSSLAKVNKHLTQQLWALQQRIAPIYLRDSLHQKHRSNPRWSFSHKTRFLFSPKLRRSSQIGIWLKSEMQTKSTSGALRSCTPFRISIFWASLCPAPWRSGIRVGFSTARRVAQKALHPFLLVPWFLHPCGPWGSGAFVF